MHSNLTLVSVIAFLSHRQSPYARIGNHLTLAKVFLVSCRCGKIEKNCNRCRKNNFLHKIWLALMVTVATLNEKLPTAKHQRADGNPLLCRRQKTREPPPLLRRPVGNMISFEIRFFAKTPQHLPIHRLIIYK